MALSKRATLNKRLEWAKIGVSRDGFLLHDPRFLGVACGACPLHIDSLREPTAEYGRSLIVSRWLTDSDVILRHARTVSSSWCVCRI
jgi:hypothetical protein